MKGFPSIFYQPPGQTLILASTSPRRRDMLASLGLHFSIMSPSVAEPAPLPEQSPENYVLSLASLKAESAANMAPVSASVLAADTVVVADNEILGKPADKNDAVRMLVKLNGRGHHVVSAFCLMSSAFCVRYAESSQVFFRDWPLKILEAYAQTGESMDKAGAYAIQGKGSFLVEKLSGSWTNVVGLPLTALVQCLLERGLILPYKSERDL